MYVWTGLYVCMSTNVHIYWDIFGLVKYDQATYSVIILEVCLPSNSFIYIIKKYPRMMWNDRIILVN